jgi:hypothetical protein
MANKAFLWRARFILCVFRLAKAMKSPNSLRGDETASVYLAWLVADLREVGASGAGFPSGFLILVRAEEHSLMVATLEFLLMDSHRSPIREYRLQKIQSFLDDFSGSCGSFQRTSCGRKEGFTWRALAGLGSCLI